MDPLTITATRVDLSATIANISFSVNQFIRNVRDARSDMDVVSRELGSLNTVIEIVAEDVKLHDAKLEDNMRIQLVGIVGNCASVIERLDTSLKKYQQERLTANIRWTVSGKMEMEGFSRELSSHRGALDTALNFVTLAITRDIKTDTEALLNETAELKQSEQQNTEKILAEIARLRAQLPEVHDEHLGSGVMLQKYLDNLTTDAETAYAGSVQESDLEPGEDEILSNPDAAVDEQMQKHQEGATKADVISPTVESDEVTQVKTLIVDLPSTQMKRSPLVKESELYASSNEIKRTEADLKCSDPTTLTEVGSARSLLPSHSL